MGKKLPLSFYRRSSVVDITRELIGKTLCTKINGQVTSGRIVEAEAYSGMVDKASHAFQNKRTKRTSIMFEEGGCAYVYLCYGIHRLFNITTNKKGKPDAILIRAIEPFEGINTMLKRRNQSAVSKRLGSGPGVVSKALGIELEHYGQPLNSNLIWVEDTRISNLNVVATTRVGVDYAEEDALLKWRFYMKDSQWVSVL